jgi:hypothetical protein
MPRYTNKFKRAEYHDEEIIDGDGRLDGTIRIKPSSVMWKPSGSRMFYSVRLAKFKEWIVSKSTEATRATR